MFSAIEHQQATVATGGLLKLQGSDRLGDVSPGSRTGHPQYRRDWSKGGRMPCDPMLMFRMLVVQKFHGLSDEATE